MATTPSPQPPPSTAGSAAKNISPAELQRELAGGGRAAPADNIPPTVTFDDGPPPDNVTLGDDKGNRDVEPPMPSLRKAARELAEKKAQQAADEPAPEKSKKAEAKKEDAPVAKDTPPPPADDDIPEDQRRVLPHDKPDTAKRIKYFLSEIKKREAAIAEKEAELTKLRTRPETPANAESIKVLEERLQKAEADLLRYRRRYDLDNDEGHIAKYRTPVVEAEKSIEETLKKYGFTDGTLKTIENEGGFAAFSRSRRAYPVSVPDPENEGKTKIVYRTGADIARDWLSGLDVADSEHIKQMVGKQQLIKSEEQAAIKQAQDEAEEYFKKQFETAQAAQKTAAEAQAKTLQEYTAFIKEAMDKTDWLAELEVPANATEEQRKAIAEENAFRKELRDGIAKEPANAKEYGEMKLASLEARHLRRIMADKDARIADLEEQLKKAKGAMRTTPRGGSLLRGNGEQPKAKTPDDPTDFRSAMRELAAKMAGGVDE